MQSILLASGNITAVGQSVTCGVADADASAVTAGALLGAIAYA